MTRNGEGAEKKKGGKMNDTTKISDENLCDYR